jgi:glycerol uptake facilitator-like aquaporin
VTSDFSRGRKLAAEALGSFLLAATVIGSGVMAERLAAGNEAVALLANTLATMAALYVLIMLFGPISGAHFNPAVTLAMRLRKQIGAREGLLYVAAQIAAMIAGAWAAHAMFDLPILQLSHKSRDSGALLFAEFIASFGLLTTIWLGLRFSPRAVPALVACWIGAAYWFTASTSFANPAITIARALSDTFAGIRPQDAPGFIAAQFVGAMAATAFCSWLVKSPIKPSHNISA